MQSDIKFSTFGGICRLILRFKEGLFYPEMLKLQQVTVRISEDFIPYSRRHDRLNFQLKSSPVTGLEWPRGFQEVKVPRFHDNGTGWW
jgi:hypothetical protein